MPTILREGFADYIEGLTTLGKRTKDNYRQYIRWVEQYGDGEVTIAITEDRTKLEDYLDTIAAKWDAESAHILTHHRNSGMRKSRLSFTERRKDVKTVLGLHYLNFLKSQHPDVEQIEQELDDAGEFNISTEFQAKRTVLRSIVLRRGQPKFRRDLLRAYAGKCAFTGTAIEDVLEAAHIIPYNGDSTNHIGNGLLLRSDIHALFDLGLVSVDPATLCICCSQRLKDEPIYVALN